MVKRLMYSFKFFQFKTRLINKCNEHNVNLFVVDESYTSKTCGECGLLNNNLGTKKTFICSCCNNEIDRDKNGARNILIKNLLS